MPIALLVLVLLFVTATPAYGHSAQQTQIDALKARVAGLEARVAKLEGSPTATPTPTPTTPTPTPTATATPTPTPSPTATPTATPTNTACDAKQTTWRTASIGFVPLTDSDAAALVCRNGYEPRPQNAPMNAYVPTATELASSMGTERNKFGELIYEWNPRSRYVTGNFTGTTDEILQWAAHKWGIPEDWVRAQAASESWWTMLDGVGTGFGDRTTVTNALNYPDFSRIDTDEVWQSLGIMQVRWNHPDANNAGIGAEPLRWKSTAFNVDYVYAQIRYYFDGLCGWCGTGYSAGQQWNSVGAWYNPSPWGTSSDSYEVNVQTKLANRVWEQPGF